MSDIFDYDDIDDINGDASLENAAKLLVSAEAVNLSIEERNKNSSNVSNEITSINQDTSAYERNTKAIRDNIAAIADKRSLSTNTVQIDSIISKANSSSKDNNNVIEAKILPIINEATQSVKEREEIVKKLDDHIIGNRGGLLNRATILKNSGMQGRTSNDAYLEKLIYGNDESYFPMDNIAKWLGAMNSNGPINATALLRGPWTKIGNAYNTQSNGYWSGGKISGTDKTQDYIREAIDKVREVNSQLIKSAIMADIENYKNFVQKYAGTLRGHDSYNGGFGGYIPATTTRKESQWGLVPVSGVYNGTMHENAFNNYKYTNSRSSSYEFNFKKQALAQEAEKVRALNKEYENLASTLNKVKDSQTIKNNTENLNNAFLSQIDKDTNNVIKDRLKNPSIILSSEKSDVRSIENSLRDIQNMYEKLSNKKLLSSNEVKAYKDIENSIKKSNEALDKISTLRDNYVTTKTNFEEAKKQLKDGEKASTNEVYVTAKSDFVKARQEYETARKNLKNNLKADTQRARSLSGLNNGTDLSRIMENRGRMMTYGFDLKSLAYSGIANKLGYAATGAIGAVVGVISVAAQKLGNEIKSSLNKFSEIQSLQVRLETIYGDNGAANAAFDEIKAYAKKSPFGVEPVTEMAVQLKQSGVYAVDLLDTLKMIGDVSGSNSEKMKRIANNYAQIVANGRATTRDLREFANAGLPIYRALQEVKGTTISNVYAMAGNGEIKFKDIEQAFKNMTSPGGVFDEAVEKNSKTYMARKQNLKDARDLRKAEVGKYISNTKPYELWYSFIEFMNESGEAQFKEKNIDLALKKQSRTELKADSTIQSLLEKRVSVLENTKLTEKERKDKLDKIDKKIESIVNELGSDDRYINAKNIWERGGYWISKNAKQETKSLVDAYDVKVIANNFAQQLDKYINDTDSLSTYVTNSNNEFDKTENEKRKKDLEDKIKWDEQYELVKKYKTYVDNEMDFTTEWTKSIDDLIDMYEKGFFITKNTIDVAYENIANDTKELQVLGRTDNALYQEKLQENNNNWSQIGKNFNNLMTLDIAQSLKDQGVTKDLEALSNILKGGNTTKNTQRFISSFKDLIDKLDLLSQSGNSDAEKLKKVLPSIMQYFDVIGDGIDWLSAKGNKIPLASTFVQSKLGFDSNIFNKYPDISDNDMFQMYKFNTQKNDIAAIVKSVLATDVSTSMLKDLVIYQQGRPISTISGYRSDTVVSYNELDPLITKIIKQVNGETLSNSSVVNPYYNNGASFSPISNINPVLTNEELDVWRQFIRESGGDVRSYTTSTELTPIIDKLSTFAKNEKGIAQIDWDATESSLAKFAFSLDSATSITQSYISQQQARLDTLNEFISQAAVFTDSVSDTIDIKNQPQLGELFDNLKNLKLNNFQVLFDEVDSGIYKVNKNAVEYAISMRDSISATQGLQQSFLTLKTSVDTINAQVISQKGQIFAQNNIDTYNALSGLSEENKINYMSTIMTALENNKDKFRLNDKFDEAKFAEDFLDNFLMTYQAENNYGTEVAKDAQFWRDIANKGNNYNFEDARRNAMYNGRTDEVFYDPSKFEDAKKTGYFNAQADAYDAVSGFWKLMVELLFSTQQLNDLQKDAKKKSKDTYPLWQRIINSSLGVDLNLFKNGAITNGTQAVDSFEKTRQRESIKNISRAMLDTISARDVFDGRIDYGNPRNKSYIVNNTSSNGVTQIDWDKTYRNFSNFAMSLSSATEVTKAYVSSLTDETNSLKDFLSSSFTTVENPENIWDEEYQKQLGSLAGDIKAVDANAYDMMFVELGDGFLKLRENATSAAEALLKQKETVLTFASAIENSKNKINELQMESGSNNRNAYLKLGGYRELNNLTEESASKFIEYLNNEFSNDRWAKIKSNMGVNTEELVARYLRGQDLGSYTDYEKIATSEASQKLINDAKLKADNLKQEYETKQAELDALYKEHYNYTKNSLIENGHSGDSEEKLDDLTKRYMHNSTYYARNTKAYEDLAAATQKAGDAYYEAYSNYEDILDKHTDDYKEITVYGRDFTKSLDKVKEEFLNLDKTASELKFANAFNKFITTGLATGETRVNTMSSLVSPLIGFTMNGTNTYKQQKALKYAGLSSYDFGYSASQILKNADGSLNNENATSIIQSMLASNPELLINELKKVKPDFNPILAGSVGFDASKLGLKAEDLFGALSEWGNYLAQIENVENALVSLGETFGNTFKDNLLDGMDQTLKQIGKNIVTATWESEDFANIWKNVGKSMLDAIGPAMAQAGLSLITNGQVAAGVALLAASGVASIMSGMLTEDTSDKDKQQEARLKNLKELLSEIIDQAKTDAEYYQKNIIHQNALQESDVISVNDAVITPSGQVISTAPDDYLIATKTPETLASKRGGSVVNFTMVDQSTGVEVKSMEQTENADGSIDIKAIIVSAVGAAVADGSLDDSFIQRDVRLNGKSYAY